MCRGHPAPAPYACQLRSPSRGRDGSKPHSSGTSRCMKPSSLGCCHPQLRQPIGVLCPISFSPRRWCALLLHYHSLTAVAIHSSVNEVLSPVLFRPLYQSVHEHGAHYCCATTRYVHAQPLLITSCNFGYSSLQCLVTIIHLQAVTGTCRPLEWSSFPAIYVVVQDLLQAELL